MNKIDIIVYALGGVVIFLVALGMAAAIYSSVHNTYEEQFKRLITDIAKDIDGWGLYRINISICNVYHDECFYLVVIVDNNYCQPFYGGELYYNKTLVVEYGRGIRECDGQGYSYFKVYNETLLKSFVEDYLKGYNMNWK